MGGGNWWGGVKSNSAQGLKIGYLQDRLGGAWAPTKLVACGVHGGTWKTYGQKTSKWFSKNGVGGFKSLAHSEIAEAG